MNEKTSRDWKKDMDRVALSRLLMKKHEVTPNVESIDEVLAHWLQAYAAEANDVCYWKGEAEAEKHRADAADAKAQELFTLVTARKRDQKTTGHNQYNDR